MSTPITHNPLEVQYLVRMDSPIHHSSLGTSSRSYIVAMAGSALASTISTRSTVP
jgi:hypothetical protein